MAFNLNSDGILVTWRVNGDARHHIPQRLARLILALFPVPEGGVQPVDLGTGVIEGGRVPMDDLGRLLGEAELALESDFFLT